MASTQAHRKASPEYREIERKRERARHHALMALKARHPGEYENLYAKACANEGIETRRR